MLPLLVLVSLVRTVIAPAVRNGTTTLPISDPTALASSAIIDTVDVTCDDINNCRTLLSIIWSCLVTIFACIWVAIHRNIPGPQQRWITIQLESLKIVILALLVPEWILAWAVRQFLRARQLVKQLEAARKKAPRNTPKDTELGRTDKPWTITHAFFAIMGGFQYYRGGEPLYPLSPDDVLALVRKGELVPPTEDELKDKSKRDALSKSFVIIQTLWFVVQCIARRIEHLPITELEIMTLAYTVITVAMYGFWWCKPLNVVCPVRVWGKDKARAEPRRMDWAWGRVIRLMNGNQDDDVNLQEEKQVPTFYSGGDDRGDIMAYADIIALSVAMIFGAVHCVVWSNAFPSHTEMLLWRISSLAIVAIPVAIFLALVVGYLVRESLSETLSDIIMYSVSITCASLYIAARILLLALSFSTLRSIPLAAYQTVQWTTFIPHI